MPPDTTTTTATATTLRRAKPSEAAALTALAIAAKAHWGYSEEFMAAARAELTITPDDIASRPFIVAEQAGGEGAGGGSSLAAVYGIAGTPPRAELSVLWVLPDRMGTGLGSLLSRAPVLDTLTLTPWRVKGPLDKPGVSLDSELWAKTAVKKLSPEGLLRGGLKDLLRPK